MLGIKDILIALRAVFGAGADVNLPKLLKTLVEVSVDTGVADDTSAVNHLDDSAKSWPVNAFTNLIVEITGGTGEDQIRKIASNTATSIVPVTNFDTAPDSTSTYRIGFFGKMASDITAWGGTALTGRDISLDLKALVDDSIKGILKSIGDAGTAENLLERIGEVQATPTANTVLDRLKAILGASTPTKYALAITDADTEYSQALPANTKQFSVHLRDYSAFRLAYVTGKVATPTDPYETVPAGSEKYVENIAPASLTLYIAAPAGTKVAEIEAWA